MKNLDKVELTELLRSDVSAFNAYREKYPKQEINFYNADLRGADLLDANLRGADLRNADLKQAILLDANLRGADLRGADLYHANLINANIKGANFNEADIRDVYIKLTKKTIEAIKSNFI